MTGISCLATGVLMLWSCNVKVSGIIPYVSSFGGRGVSLSILLRCHLLFSPGLFLPIAVSKSSVLISSAILRYGYLLEWAFLWIMWIFLISRLHYILILSVIRIAVYIVLILLTFATKTLWTLSKLTEYLGIRKNMYIYLFIYFMKSCIFSGQTVYCTYPCKC